MKQSETTNPILYAEDDYANRKLIELQLKRRGFSCLSVEDGQQAVDAYGQGDFSLVILDYNMPGLSGLDTLRKIRELNSLQKIMALTSDDSLAPELLTQGFNRVVIKPVLDDSLLDAVMDLVQE